MKQIYSFSRTTLLLFLLILGVGSSWCSETTYVFQNRDWNAKIGDTGANWTSITRAAGYTAGQGTQITTSSTGACAYSPTSFTNITNIEVQYCTNNKAGVGGISLYCGDATAIASAQGGTQIGSTFSVSAPKSGGTTLKTASWTNLSLSGYVQIYVTCTTNSVYIYSIKITTSDGPTKLSAPANLYSSNVTTAGATLSWDAVANASSYTVTIGDTEYPNAISPYSATGLSSNTTYNWTVKAVGDGTNYSTSDDASTVSFKTAPALLSIAVSGTPTKLTYEVGETLDPSGLVVTANYEGGSSEVVTEDINWTFDPNTFALDNTSCSVIATWSGKNSTAYTVSDIVVNAPSVKYNISLITQPTMATIESSLETAAEGVEVTLSYSDVAEHYHFVSWSVVDAESNPIVVTENKFIMPASDVTVSATFKEDDKYAVIYHVNGSTTAKPSVILYEGDAIDLTAPTSGIPSGYSFQGWYGEPYSNPTKAPIYIKSANMGTVETHYYAVFAVEEEIDPYWKKITNVNDVQAGTYAVISHDGGYYLPNATATSGAPSCPAVTKTGTTIDVLDAMKWKLSINDNGSYTLESAAATGNYLWGAPTNEGIRIGTTSAKSNAFKEWTIESDDTYGLRLKDYGSTGRYLSTYGTQDWRNYTSNSASNRAGNLYKLVGGTTKSDYRTSVIALTGISIKSAPNKVAYCEGEFFNPQGLIITALYADESTADVTYEGNEPQFSFSPTLDAELTADDKQVTITYKDNNCQQAINVRTVSISAPTTVEGTYTVKVGDADAVTADGNTIAAKKGQKIVLASTANPGYRVQSTPFVVKDEKNVDVSVSTAGGQYSFTMPDKDVTITAKYSKLYTLTAAATTNGSIAIKWNNTTVTEAVKGNKIVIEVSPAEHYYLSSLYYVKEGEETQNTINKTDEVYSFTMEDANTTIYATFAEDEKHEAIFYVNGEESSRAYVYTGENVVFPETNPEDQGGKVFMGWASEQIDGTQADAPTFANETGVTMENADIPFYAVFATATGSSTDYSYTLDTSTSPYNSDGYQNGEKKVTATCPTDNTKTFDVTYQITNFGRVSGQLQMKKSGDGYMYNTTDLGSITSVTIDDGSNLTTYYGSSQNPQSGTSVGTGNGYFRIVAGSTAGTCSSITVAFAKSTVTYSAYATSFATLALVAENADGKWATFSSDRAVEFDENTTVYTVSVSGNTMSLVEVENKQVPANTGVLVKAASTSVNYTYIAAADDLDDNMLYPASKNKAELADHKFYKLAYASSAKDNLGFYWGAENGGAFTSREGSAYLAVPAGTLAPARFIFGQQGVPTELQNVSAEIVSRKVMIDGCLYILRDGKTYDSLGRLVK